MNFAKYRVQLSTEKKYSSKYEYKYEYEYSIPAKETVLLSAHNIYFGLEIRKKSFTLSYMESSAFIWASTRENLSSGVCILCKLQSDKRLCFSHLDLLQIFFQYSS